MQSDELQQNGNPRLPTGGWDTEDTPIQQTLRSRSHQQDTIQLSHEATFSAEGWQLIGKADGHFYIDFDGMPRAVKPPPAPPMPPPEALRLHLRALSVQSCAGGRLDTAKFKWAQAMCGIKVHFPFAQPLPTQ